MPSGRYAVRGRSGDVVGTEDFRCAPGPMGWRYFSEIQRDEPTPHRETVDVVVDASWGIVRARIETGSHAILLEPRDGLLAGLRDGQHVDVPWGTETHLDYLSPAFNAITARRLEDAPADGTAQDIDVVYLEPVTLEPIQMRQRYELIPTGARRHTRRPVPRRPLGLHRTRDRMDQRSLGRGRRRRPVRPSVRAHRLRGGGVGTRPTPP